jgi:hypothetical protein
MSALDLNRMAIAMGKICIALDDLESKIIDGDDVYENKDGVMAVAYMFRIGVIEMIEKPENKYMQNPTLPIVIPLGIFKHRKETIGSAFRLTLGRLLNLAEKNDEINQAVADILDGGDLYKEIEQSSTLIRRDLFR